MPRLFRLLPGRSITAVLLASGLGVGAYWLGQHQPLGTAQAQATTPLEATAGQDLDPKSVKVSAQPAGRITALTTDPTGFTFRDASSAEKTVRVTAGTSFQAGRDRPYNFGLLRVGDYVRVQAPGLRPKAAGQVKPKDGAKKPGAPGRTQKGAARKDAAFADDGTPIARRVMVRPAAEGPFGQPRGRKPCLSKPDADQAAPFACPTGRQKKGGLDDGAQQ